MINNVCNLNEFITQFFENPIYKNTNFIFSCKDLQNCCVNILPSLVESTGLKLAFDFDGYYWCSIKNKNGDYTGILFKFDKVSFYDLESNSMGYIEIV